MSLDPEVIEEIRKLAEQQRNDWIRAAQAEHPDIDPELVAMIAGGLYDRLREIRSREICEGTGDS